jgi:hypothetical protein
MVLEYSAQFKSFKLSFRIWNNIKGATRKSKFPERAKSKSKSLRRANPREYEAADLDIDLDSDHDSINFEHDLDEHLGKELARYRV